MLALDDARWSTLADAYGPAMGIPKLLRQAEELPEDLDNNAEPYFSLWSALCHQSDVYSASYAALPHLVRIVGENPETFRWTLLSLAQHIEAGRLEGRGPPIPDDLKDAYRAALVEVPSVALRLLGGNPTELEMRVILSCCASAKGFSLLSDAINVLTPERVSRLLEDERYQ